MPFPLSLRDTPIYTIVEADLQMVARDRIGRNLTAEELHQASHIFANGMNWWDVAVSAVDIATEKQQ